MDVRSRATRTPLRLAVAGLLAAGLLAPGCGGDPAERPPSLLLVTIDSLRADALACYGGEPGVGRRICSLADQGTRYVWAFSTASSSAPAVASILTSRYPGEHGVDASAASFLADDHETLAEALAREGYATAAFVASPELNRSRNLQQGFEVYDDQTRRPGPSVLPTRPATETTDAALAWLAGLTEQVRGDGQQARRPWLLWVHYREPHGPYLQDREAEDTSEATQPSVPDGPGERLHVLPTPAGRGGIPSYQALPGLFTRESYEARYRGAIRTVDTQIGRLLDAVASLDEAVGIAVTADHGEAFGEDRYYLSHGHSVTLDQIRVPLLWRPPSPSAPEHMSVVVSTLDVMPTFLRAAGLGRPESLAGWVLPSAQDPPGAPELARAVFALHPAQVAVVSGSNFYVRLREPIQAVAPGVTVEYLRATAARTARLEPDLDRAGRLPPLEPARPTGITPLLEPRVAEFLAGGAP